jgi:hypothetical protein
MKLDPRSLKTRKERSVKKQALPLLFLLMSLLLSLGAFGQTTTSYAVTGGSGTATTPTRISFDTSLAANQFFDPVTEWHAETRLRRRWASFC